MNKPISRRAFLASSIGLSLSADSCIALGDSTPPSASRTYRGDLSEFHRHVAQAAANIRQSIPEITLLLPRGSESNLAPVIALFEKLSGIKVKTLSTPVDDMYAAMLLSHGNKNNSFDAALPPTSRIPDLAEAGIIQNLNRFQEVYEPEHFSNSALYTLGDYYNGNFYGYQTDGDVFLMFYNTNFLTEDNKKAYQDSSGEDYRIPVTWQELDQQMAFFHKPDKGRYGGALFRTQGYIAWEWWLRFHAKGSLPFNDDFEIQVDNQHGIEALKELISASRFLHKKCSTNSLFENWDLYKKGECFANIGWGGTQKALNQQDSRVKGKMIFSPSLGGYRNGKRFYLPYFNWGWNYTISSQSEKAETAYLFSLFAASPIPSSLAVREHKGFFDPFRNEHYDDAQITQAYSHQFLQEHKKSMKTCIPDLYLGGHDEYFRSLNKYITLANEGSITAEKAMSTIKKNWYKIQRKNDLKNSKKQWKYLKNKYPSHTISIDTI